MAIPAVLGALAGSAGAAGAGAGGLLNDVMNLVGAVQMVKHTLANLVPSISRAAGNFEKVISYIPDAILSVAGEIEKAAKKWGAAIYAPIDVLHAAGSGLTRGVARVNPAVVQQFNIALEDAEGVIGRQLLPVLVRLTSATRSFADYLVKIEPITSRLGNALIKVIDIGERLGKTFGDNLIPVIEGITEVIEIQVTWWKQLAKAMDFAMKWSILGQIVKATGLDKDAPDSRGASIRSVRYMGSEEIQQEVARQSLIASMAKGPNKEEQAQDAAITAANLLQQILDFAKGRWSGKEAARGIAEGAVGGIAGGNPNMQVDALAVFRGLALGAMGGF